MTNPSPSDSPELTKLLDELRRFTRCRTIHMGYGQATTCFDVKEEAERNPDRFGEKYRANILADMHLCEFCRAANAVAAIEQYVARLELELARKTVQLDACHSTREFAEFQNAELRIKRGRRREAAV